MYHTLILLLFLLDYLAVSVGLQQLFQFVNALLKVMSVVCISHCFSQRGTFYQNAVRENIALPCDGILC